MKSMLTILVVAACVSLAEAGEDTLTAEGVGQGVNRDEALLSAKRNAVEQGIGTILLSQTEIENFELKRDQVVTKTVGAVQRYDLLSEKQSAEGLYEIRIRAVLSRSTMHKDLAAFQVLIESMDRPRVMVIVKESNVGKDEPSNRSAETALIGFLKDPYDFDVVDPQAVAAIRASGQDMAALAGDAAAAAAIGARQGAEVLITGTAVSRKAEGVQQDLGGMVSVQADVSLRAFNCTTARIIGTATGRSANLHINPNTAGNKAIATAAVESGRTLLDAIVKDWQAQLNNGIPLTIYVNGVGSFKSRKAVIQALRQTAGVAAVRERNWNSQARLLQADVQYKGNAEGFCDRADGLKLEPGGTLAVSGVEGLKITLTANGAP